MERHKVNGQIMARRDDIERFRIIDQASFGKKVVTRAYNNRIFKRPVNQTQTIKEFIAGDVVQKSIACARAIADQRVAISEERSVLHMSRLIALGPILQTLVHAVFRPNAFRVGCAWRAMMAFVVHVGAIQRLLRAMFAMRVECRCTVMCKAGIAVMSV
jgi:hypothetical protein